MEKSAEQQRLDGYTQHQSNWKLWGPYLSERAWGTVREDYSPDGKAWDFFPFEHASSRVFRWNEDGLAGICDRNQYLCFALALWNEQDPILKERLFGLSGTQGNHGEDVKEYYFYLDSTPTHSYMKMLYKYPHNAFPYSWLIEENSKRGVQDSEFELLDTGIFNENRYFDVFVEFAKADEEDILIQIAIYNRGPDAATCHVLPTLWFRNTWSWGYPNGPMDDVPGKPTLRQVPSPDANTTALEANHSALGQYHLYADGAPKLLFTENETNRNKIYGDARPQQYVKDAFERLLINNEVDAVNPHAIGTKSAAHYALVIPPQGHQTIRLRLSKKTQAAPFQNFQEVFDLRKSEADAFYQEIQNPELDEEERFIQRQAFANMLWSKQLYYYDVEQWLHGDPPPQPPPSPQRLDGRNHPWEHLVNFDIISMPDKWEYPWYASWDLAFHCIPLVLVDADFAKRQLTLMTREWYMHPNGQLPAYEWEFSNVNPPVHAWATWRTYKIDSKQSEKPDTNFLKGIFNKLLMNFTWWVNRKDAEGKNIFQGGFLGLDNISLFDRSQPLPFGGQIDQSDATAWMAFYCMNMMKIALELSKTDPVYQDAATKFFEHYLRIAGAMNNCGGRGISLWDAHDGFYYDVLHLPDDKIIPLKVRSLVGLLPLLAVETLEPEPIKATPIFKRRVEWFISKKTHVAGTMASMFTPGVGARRLLSILTKEKLLSVLRYMLDENEFLSEYGIRSLSKYHQDHPYVLHCHDMEYTIKYEPGDAQTKLYGGNSNWRGPIWFPLNFLLIEALQRYYHYYGDELKVEFPTGSGHLMNLWEVAQELSKRLIKLFKVNGKGHRPLFGGHLLLQEDPHWQEMLLFYEFYHGDYGLGLGASHQTGWTGLIAKLIQQSGGKL